jgi:hypothetical protein
LRQIGRVAVRAGTNPNQENFAMSKRHQKGQKTKSVKNVKKENNELTDQHLETVSGGIIAVLQPNIAQKSVNGDGVVVKLVPAVNVDTIGRFKLY